MDGRTLNGCVLWTGNKAYNLVQSACDVLNNMGYSLTLDETRLSGFGFTQSYPNGSIFYNVGVKEIKDNPHSRFPLHKALAPTVACFHEVCGHGGQWRNELYKDTHLSRILILNDLACRGSADYYGVTSDYSTPYPHYFEQPHEIAAQYMALKMIQRFLTAVYNEEKADKLLTEYVNLRIASETEYIKAPDDYEMEIPTDGRPPFMKHTEPFDCMTDVYAQFQKTFEEQATKPVIYKITKNSNDIASQYIDGQKLPWRKFNTRKQINQISDRMIQTYILSAIWLDKNRSWSWIKDCPAFEHMEFPTDIKSIIYNRPKPQNKEGLDLEWLTEEDIDFTNAVRQLPSDDGPTL